MEEASSVSGFEPFILPSQSRGTYLLGFKFSLHTGLSRSLYVLQKLRVSHKVGEVNSTLSYTIEPLKDEAQTALRPSPYRTVNTFHLGYKNQSVYVSLFVLR